MTPTISKTDYQAWRRCPKLAWYRFHRPEKLAPPGPATQALTEQGYAVDRLARQLFPGGQSIGGTGDAVRDLERTTAGMRARRPLYEATLGADAAFIRADVLAPVGRTQWDLFETKSATQVDEHHLHDVAFQAHVLGAASVPLRYCHVIHLNRDYVRHGAIDPKKILHAENVTEQVDPLVRQAAEALPQIAQLRQRSQAPTVAVGPHCESPQRCPLYEMCWKKMPAANVFTLYRGGKRAIALQHSHIVRIDQIPADARLTARQKIQRAAVISGQPQVNVIALRKFLDRLKYPLALLDFETYATAIPLFDGLKPYQQVPFQFSCHVVTAPGARPEARAFLCRQAHDPRPEFVAELRRQMPSEGSIVVYNAAFERSRLAECGKFLPAFRPWLRRLGPRFLDLLEPFREFHYYHPAQHGSASIKAVLPALTGKSYRRLAIQDGATAALKYLEATFGKSVEAERQAVWEDLEKYCAQDTLGMLWIIQALDRVAKHTAPFH